MLMSLLNFLLISNALILRKDKSILFSRIVMVSLILSHVRFILLVFIWILTGFILAKKKLNFKPENIILSSSLSITISVLTLILLTFIFIPNKLFNVANISNYLYSKLKSC